MPYRSEVSVFRTDGLSDQEIWKIGDEIAEPRARNVHARGDIRALSVRQNGLDVIPAEPPPRHANIIGWPTNDKGKQKLIALQLADIATLVIKAAR